MSSRRRQRAPVRSVPGCASCLKRQGFILELETEFDARVKKEEYAKVIQQRDDLEAAASVCELGLAEAKQAAEEAASREAEVIKARREEVRMNALVTGEPAPMGGMPMGGMPMGGMPMGGGGMAAAGGGRAAAGGAMGGMAQDAPMQPQMGGAATQFV